MQNAVVTGVSTGIGRGATLVLIKQGWHVFGSVRNAADGAALKQEFGASFTPLLFDVEDNDAVLRAAELVRNQLRGRTLDGLVNNAGSSYVDPLMVQSVEDFRKQVNVSLVGMFAVTRAFAPLLGVDQTVTGPKGRIINISSVGGQMSFPFLGAYAAAKHGVEGFSEALRRELQLFGVDVIIVAPGSVDTAVWDKAEAMSQTHLNGTPWEKPFRAFTNAMIKGGRAGYTIEYLGEVVAKALTTPKPKTRYLVAKKAFANVTIPGLLPKRRVDRLIGKQLGLLPKS